MWSQMSLIRPRQRARCEEELISRQMASPVAMKAESACSIASSAKRSSSSKGPEYGMDKAMTLRHGPVPMCMEGTACMEASSPVRTLSKVGAWFAKDTLSLFLPSPSVAKYSPNNLFQSEKKVQTPP